MKKITKLSKLTLKKSTIVMLNSNDMNHVQGGSLWSIIGNCQSDNTNCMKGLSAAYSNCMSCQVLKTKDTAAL